MASLTQEGASTKERPLSNWAQIASAVVAAIGLGGIWYQVSIVQFNAQHASARQVYMFYADSALKYPQFGVPKLEEIMKDRTEYVRYQIYVAHMLFAYDEMISLEKDERWRKGLRYDLRDHKEYLCQAPRDEFEGIYHAPTQKIVNKFFVEECKKAS